ncbi:MAG: N-acetylglucosamine-6-phosphate deacetylase [Planctomycetota bacterium]
MASTVSAFTAARIWPVASEADASVCLREHAVLVAGDRVDRVAPLAEIPAGAQVTDLGEVDLVPGFVDVQVNGGGGALFNDDPTLKGIRTIVAAHRRFGTTSLLPTFITDSVERMMLARAAVNEALNGAEPGVLGVHFEGPFLDERKTGAHDRDHVRPPGEADLGVIRGSGLGVTLLTLAAKHLSARVAEELRRADVRVALGHCASTFDEAAFALESGSATGVTHLYNAMSALESRAPGLVGAAFASESATCGLILDGVHVAYGAARAAFAALGHQRLMLVTDSVQPVGTDLREFSLGGQSVRLENGACINEEGNLAGSALDMATAVRNAVEHLEVDLGTAVCMASLTPAAFLGLEGDVGSLRPGGRADMAILDGGQRCVGTIVGGQSS